MDEDDFVSTPFGLIRKPTPAAAKPKPEPVHPQGYYTSSYTREHGWFAPLYDSEGNVK